MRMVIVMVLMTVCGLEIAAAAPPEPQPAADADEVTIEAQREKLHVLRAQLEQLQEKIYANYNQLNPEHEYDIVCSTDVATNSHIGTRICLPVFARQAKAEEAHDFMVQFGLLGHPAPPASMEILRKRQDFTRNYRRVINSNPELLKLDREYGDLVRQYQTVRRQKFKGKLVVWD